MVDISQTARGNASFRAFRLTKAFLDAYKKKDFSTDRCVVLAVFGVYYEFIKDLYCIVLRSLIEHGLTFSSIVEEIPLRIRTNPLLGSFLETLGTSSPISSSDAAPSTASATAALPPSFSCLNLGTGNVSRNLEQIVEALDAYKTEEGNLGYLQRQIAREKARAEAHVTKRKEENVVRVAAGLAPLPEEDVSRLYKIPPEPSRLESLLVLGKINAYSKSLEEVSSTGLVKMYATKANGGV